MKRCAMTLILGASLLFLTPGCNNNNNNNNEEDQQIFQNIEDDNNLSTLRDALTGAGLDSLLLEQGPFTIFAPNNNAFNQIPEETLNDLLADSAALRELLLYHVAAEELNSTEITELASITTAQGEQITVTVENGNVFLNETNQVIDADRRSENGIIHVINGVLVPDAVDLDNLDPADNNNDQGNDE